MRTHDYKFPNTKINNFAVYSDNVEFGEGSLIGSNAVIRDNVKIGNNTIIGPLVVIESDARIGNNVTIQPFSIIARDMIIQDDVFIGPHFSCADTEEVPLGEHGLSPNKPPHTAKTILIKKGARLGTHCLVAPGVIIGENAFIKMNCFIKKDVPDNTIIKSDTTYG